MILESLKTDGESGGCMSTSLERAYTAFYQDDAALALVLFEQEDKSGSGHAAHMLGWIHEAGWHVPADAQAALTYYRRAADRGTALGSVSLGRKLLQMNQLPAALIALQAVADSEPAAARMLGRCVELSLADRLFWLEKGVAMGNVYCLALSGRLLLRQSPLKNLCRGTWRIARSFGGTIFFGFRHTDVNDLNEDKRFSK